MGRNQRIALVVGAIAIAVVAFVIAQPGDDQDDGERAATTPAQTETGGGAGGGATAPAETEEEPPPTPEPEVTRLRIRDGAVVGGPRDIEVERGDTVRIVVAADAPDEIHLHGYDITRNAAPGQPARAPLGARLVVEPS